MLLTMRSPGPPLRLPRNLVEAAKREGREAWLATVPTTVANLAERWSLTVGPPFQPGGQTAWGAPVRDAAANEMVMKVGWRHPEALHCANRSFGGGTGSPEKPWTCTNPCLVGGQLSSLRTLETMVRAPFCAP